MSNTHSARRLHGVCCGSLWKQCESQSAESLETIDKTRLFEYCVLLGVTLLSFTDVHCYLRGDHPVSVLCIVGASSWNPQATPASTVEGSAVQFRLVTVQGTHVYCTALTPVDAKVWLRALHAGLERSYAISVPQAPLLKPPSPAKSPRRGLFGRRDSATSACQSCGRVGENSATLKEPVTPLPQYGFEQKCVVCGECLVAQGVWWNIRWATELYRSYKFEKEALKKAEYEIRLTVWDGLDPHAIGSTQRQEGNSDLVVSQQQVEELEQKLLSTQFESFRRTCPMLDDQCTQFEKGRIHVVEFLETILDVDSTTMELQNLKQQAFRVAGDMGSAIKLLSDMAQETTSDDLDMWRFLLEFFLDLCDEGDLQSVSFFWPQLQSIHFKLLPPIDHHMLEKVELLEDFLLTVSTQYSVQLALDLIWGCVADLEDSLLNFHATPACRRRRFAVLRFVCELESLMFDFPDGWGGGTVALGNMLTPSPHQVSILRDAMLNLQSIRRDQETFTLSRSTRMDKLRQAKFHKPPEVAAQDALRSAKHADYFSSHLSFTRRLCDIAEKLRFLEIEQRRPTLEKELSLLNASGGMGGDPLNRVTGQYLSRTVRIPMTEGHVFRSKERTPVLLLMELVEEGHEQLLRLGGATETVKQSKDDVRQNDYDLDLEMPSYASESHLNVPNTSASKVEKGSVEVKEGGEDEPESENQGCEDEPESKNQNNERDETEEFEDAHDKDDNGSDFQDAVEQIESGDAAMNGEEDTDTKPHLNRAFSSEGAKEMTTESPIPRALTAFKEPAIGDIPKTPSKNSMEKLVKGVMIDHLNIPQLEINGDGGEKEEEGGNEHVADGTGEHAAVENEDDLSEGDQKSEAPRLNKIGNGGAAGDIRRDVLTAIMEKGISGKHDMAAMMTEDAQKSLQKLDRKRAVNYMLNEKEANSPTSQGYAPPGSEARRAAREKQRKELVKLGLEDAAIKEQLDSEIVAPPSEDDEAMESIRLLLIQNQVAQGKMSQEAAARAQAINASSLRSVTAHEGPIDHSEIVEIDAGDVDPRLAGCGSLPPAVLSALTLYKGGVISTGELLELVKKDIQFIQKVEMSEEILQEESAFWGRFAFGERWAEKKARIAATSPEGSSRGWDLTGVIVKSNDDLRQEAFVMQLIELACEVFESAGLELWLNPYRILATGKTTGIIEMVRNSMSFDALKKRPGYGKGGLREHLKRMAEFSPNPSESFQYTQRNFVRSLSAYSLLSYFFLFKDRHNGNILLDTAGHVIHIDFGFVFGIAPGGSFSLEMSTPFKLTEEMMDVMGGMGSPFFSEFVTLFCCGFLALQAHMDTFLTIVEITAKGSPFKCFEGREPQDVVSKMRQRFCPELTKEQTVAFALDLIKQATQSYGTKQYDYFQYLSQGIAT